MRCQKGGMAIRFSEDYVIAPIPSKADRLRSYQLCDLLGASQRLLPKPKSICTHFLHFPSLLARLSNY